jgi:hypothetical protein
MSKTYSWNCSGQGGIICLPVAITSAVAQKLDLSATDACVYRVAPRKRGVWPLADWKKAKALTSIGYRACYDDISGVTWIAPKGRNDLTFLSLYYSDRAITQHFMPNRDEDE